MASNQRRRFAAEAGVVRFSCLPDLDKWPSIPACHPMDYPVSSQGGPAVITRHGSGATNIRILVAMFPGLPGAAHELVMQMGTRIGSGAALRLPSLSGFTNDALPSTPLAQARGFRLVVGSSVFQACRKLIPGPLTP